MASWLLPAVKLILPHVSDIVAAAKPHFTKRKEALAGDESASGIVQQQIAELQTAASENTANIKALAEQLRITVTALEKGASEAEKRLRRAQTFAIVATATAIAALAIGVIALLT